MCSRPFETRSLPSSLAASLAVLPSMSLFPNAPFDLVGLPIYVARAPAAPFTHCFPHNFTFYVSYPIRSIRRYDGQMNKDQKSDA
jgi:hypothetical protein